MTTNTYKMTKQNLKIRIASGAKNSCHTCNELIKVGDSVITKTTNGHRIIRHQSCARRIGLID